jgi:signal transduction histidine kinase
MQLFFTGLLGVLLYLYVAKSMHRAFDESLLNLGESIGGRVEVEWEHRRLEVKLNSHGANQEDPQTYFAIADPQGNVHIKSPNLRKAKVTLPALNLKQVGETQEWVLPDGDVGEYMVVEFAPTREARKNADKRWMVFVARPTGEVTSVLEDLKKGVYLCGGLVILLQVVVSLLAVRYSLLPLREMSKQVEALDVDVLSDRLEMKRLPSEVDSVVQRINALLERVEESFKREKRFSGDVAHELRTPIAELKVITQVGLKVYEGDEEVRSFFEDSERIVRRMEKLVQCLLTLFRAANGKYELELEAVPLERCLMGLDVESADGLATQTILADESVLHAVVENLRSNAEEYGAGSMSVTVSQEGEGVCLVFCNPTEQLEPEDLERLTEVFWRKEEARSAQQHLGLGLSLVQKFVELHGWELSFALSEEKIFSVRIAGIQMVG